MTRLWLLIITILSLKGVVMIIYKTYVYECYKKVKMNIMAFTHVKSDFLKKHNCEISHSLMRSDILVIMVKSGNNIGRGHSAFARFTSSFHLYTLCVKLSGHVFGTIIFTL